MSKGILYQTLKSGSTGQASIAVRYLSRTSFHSRPYSSRSRKLLVPSASLQRRRLFLVTRPPWAKSPNATMSSDAIPCGPKTHSTNWRNSCRSVGPRHPPFFPAATSTALGPKVTSSVAPIGVVNPESVQGRDSPLSDEVSLLVPEVAKAG